MSARLPCSPIRQWSTHRGRRHVPDTHQPSYGLGRSGVGATSHRDSNSKGGNVRREGKQLFVSSRGDVRRPPNKTCRHYDNVGRLWTEVVVSLGSDSLGTIEYHLNAYLSPPATTPPFLHDSEPLSVRHCLFWNNKRDKRLYLFHCCEYRVSENLFAWCTFLF